MVFLWFSWFSYGFHHKSHEISSQQGLRRCAAALHQSHPGFSWAPKKTACLVKKGGNHGENHGIVLGKTMGNTKKEAHGFLPNMSKVPEMFFPFNQWDYRKQVMPIERRIERHLWHRFGPLLSFSQCFIQTSCKCHMNFVLL